MRTPSTQWAAIAECSNCGLQYKGDFTMLEQFLASDCSSCGSMLKPIAAPSEVPIPIPAKVSTASPKLGQEDIMAEVTKVKAPTKADIGEKLDTIANGLSALIGALSQPGAIAKAIPTNAPVASTAPAESVFIAPGGKYAGREISIPALEVREYHEKTGEVTSYMFCVIGTDGKAIPLAWSPKSKVQPHIG